MALILKANGTSDAFFEEAVETFSIDELISNLLTLKSSVLIQFPIHKALVTVSGIISEK